MNGNEAEAVRHRSGYAASGERVENCKGATIQLEAIQARRKQENRESLLLALDIRKKPWCLRELLIAGNPFD